MSIQRLQIAPSSNLICLFKKSYLFLGNKFPLGTISITRLIKPDFASVICTGLFVPINKIV